MNADSIIDEAKATDGACTATTVEDILNSLCLDHVTGLYVKNAFSALLKLLRNREGAVNMHRACGELTVMAMLRAKATVAVVQSYGFVLMRKLCCVCMESNHILVENGAVTVIAEALRRFPNDTILQASACGALLPFVKYAAPGSVDALLSCAILPLLVRLLVFQTDQHPSQITIYACLVLAEVCDRRGQTAIHQIRHASLTAGDDEWMFLHASLTILRGSLRHDDGRKLSCAVSTFILCLMSMDRVVTKVVEELGGIPTVSSAMVKYANDAGILKYSDTVCQQLAKAASPSPKKGTHRPPKGSKTKARATDRVVLDVQLPIVSAIPPHRDIQAAVQITESHMVQENKVIAAYGGAPCKQHLPGDSDVLRHATNRFRPSPSDPNLPLLGHFASGDGKHEADAKRPSRPAKPSSKHAPTTAPKVFLAPAIDAPPASSPKKRQTSGASPQAKKGGRSVNDAQKTNVSTRQTSNAAIDVTVAAKAPPARSSSVGVSPRLATPKVVVEHAWGDPLENPSQPTSPVRPSHRKFAPAAPAGNGASVFRFRHAVGTSGRRSPVVYDSTGEYPHLVKRATAPSIHQRPPPEKKNDSMTAKLSSEQQAPLLSDLADVCQSSVADESSFVATSRTNGPPDHRLLDGPSNTPLALSEMAGDMTQAPASDSAGGVPLTHPLMELPRHEDPLHAEEARSRQVDPIFVAKPCVVHLPCHDEDAAPVHLDPAMLDSILGEAMAKAPPSGRRFLPMTPANTFVGLENAGIPLPGCSPSPVQSLNVGVVLDTEAGHDVEVSLLACQLARSWLYDGIVRVCDPLIHRARVDVQTIDVSQHPRELSSTKAPQSSQEARGAAGMHTTDDVSVLVSLLAGQLVRGWSFGAQDRILSQHDCAQQNVTTLELNDGDGEPRIPEAPAIQTLLPTAMEDYTVAMARIAKQLVDMWLYDSVERMVSKAEVVSPTLRPMCGIALEESCQPAQDVSAAFPCQQQELEKLEQTGIDAVACSVVDATSGTGNSRSAYGSNQDDVCVWTARTASQLVRSWTHDALDRLVYRTARASNGRQVDVKEPRFEDDRADDSIELNETRHGKPNEQHLDRSVQADQAEALSVQVSMVASQLVRGWLFACVNSMMQSVKPLDSHASPALLLSKTILSTPQAPVGLLDDDAVVVYVSVPFMAAQLVQCWIYETIERQSTSAGRPLGGSPLGCIARGAGEAIERQAVESCQHDLSVASSVMAQRLVQAWIYETLANISLVSTTRHDVHHELSPPPVSQNKSTHGANVASARVDTSQDEQRHSVHLSLLASRLVTVWIVDTVDRLSQNRLVVGGSPDKEYARDDDFIDEGDMSALPLACTAPVDAIHEADADDDFCVDDSSPRCTSHASVPREVSLHDDLSSDKVSVYVSILAHQLIQSWLYGAIARRCAGLAVDNGPMAPPPRLKVCGEVDKVTMAEPHATGLSVAASVLAGQLVQSWIFQTLENVVLFKTQPVEQARLAQVAANSGERVALPQKSEPSCVAYLQPDDQNACDGNDENCPVLVALVADRVTKAWILEAVLNVTDALLPPLALTPSMANVVVVDDGIRCQGNSATSIPPILFFDEGELRHVDSCDFTAAAEGKTPLVRVSLLASQLVAGWVYLTMDEVLRFSTCRSNGHVSATSSPSSPRGQANEMLHGMGVDGVGPSETGRVSAYDAVDGTVAISMMAKQLVHGWVYECLLCVVDLALSKSAQAPMIHDTAMALVGTDDATMDDGADVVLEDRPVAVSVFTGHLVRLWLYEAVDKIVEFSSLHPDHEVVDDVSLHGLGDEPRSIRFIDTTKVPESTALSRDDRLDSTSDESLEVALLASLLVRAWTSDAIRNIVERCQPDGSAHKTTVNSIGSAASDGRERHLDGPTCSKFVPVAADCPWTNRSDGSNDDVSLEEVLLSNLLVRAWMGEAVLRVMCSAGTSCETVLTSDSFPVVDGYNALASEIDPPCGHETWTVGDDEERDGAFETGTSTEAHGSMEAVLLANLLVRAWTAEAMLRIMDATPPSEPVAASTPAPNALPDTNHPCAFDMVESSTATCCPCRPIEVEASRASAADNVPLELVLLANLFVRAWTSDAMQRVLDSTTTCDLPPPTTSPEGLHQLEPKQPKRPPSPHDGLHGDVVSHTATKPPLSPRLPDTIATDGEVGHDMTLEIVLLANLLVRAWVAEASMNVVDAAVEATQNPSLTSTRLLTNANPLAGDGGTSVVASTALDDDPRPKHFLPTRSTTQMVGTAATHTASASDETGVQFEKDSSFQDFSLEVFLLANLLVRAWVAEATELVSRSALLKGCVIQCTVPDEVTRLESKQETHVEVPFAPFVSPVAIPTRPSIDLDQHHIAAIFTRWNSGDVSHVSFRRLEGVYLKGAACVEDWIQAYVAAPVASAIAHVGTCQCPRQMAHLDDRDDEVAIALLASQMTRYWIFEALFNVSKKQLQHALGTTKTWG
ncbi:hypothetical protein H310_09884 [Aphanomyces invadans]|uniref:Uncharacterized protein n=1 Tax=Aphanomyces invadans TaxID=157072 RepID=A0A024TSR0_9STRA|nr:hypothetical protein H310_09884 [Aphanomyces invadans]ETV97058.1 hypothetical protein H310_09884 [Aphanomyces invadans]|eukprot:XP_008874304.1 hypothetical protein H310_09884 [Aphanomyces invadans]